MESQCSLVEWLDKNSALLKVFFANIPGGIKTCQFKYSKQSAYCHKQHILRTIFE